MREILEQTPSAARSHGKTVLVGLLAAAVGGVVGGLFFPTVETRLVEKRVEVPVEVIKHVDRVVERRVEVPVEVVKYVDRIVEKRVEVPVDKVVERRVEVPVDKTAYRLTRDEPELLDKGHLLLRVGMRKAEVLALVGRPYFDDGNGDMHFYSVFSRMNLHLRFNGDELAQIIRPK